ncbi:TonB-dependent receptor [Xanthomonas massiliensis]|uniref:TonB-dependent receptor n=1 Tax=Xanthomonas massiliensis TaxID=1720302 RepID=UPI00098ECD5A|nr:TonB-dependent receptor [Xanthomonas massiliensis]
MKRHTNANAAKLKRTALAVMLGACLANGTALAQSTSGDIVGNVSGASGQTVQIRSLDSGITRQAVISADGRFRASSIPTGQYEVTVAGKTTTVTVIAGQAATAQFADATRLDTITVKGTGPNSIDLSSVETRTTFTAQQLNTLPVSRDVTSVSLLTPGTVASSGYFGPASFGGASAAENSYYVNGFNITNLYDSLSFSEVPYQAIDQLDIQTGGYGAPFGFSTGGVTSVNTKRGTNEWKGGFSWAGVPSSLRENIDKNYRTDGSLYRSYDNNSSSSNNYTAWVGGPLIQDKLFVFALGEFAKSNNTTYGSRVGSQARDASGNPVIPTSLSTTGYDYESKTPYWLVKLDWYPNDSNHVEYTGFDNSRRYTYDYYNAAYSSADSSGNPSKTSYLGQLVGKSGGRTDIFKWTSYLTDDLTASLQYGRMRNQSSQFTISPDGVMSYYDGEINSPAGTCPYVIGTSGAQIGCAVASSVDMKGGSNERKTYRLDLDWQLGDHKIGFGYSDEKWDSEAGSSYSAGAYWRLYSAGYAMLVNYRTGGTVGIDQKSWYLDDHWQITDNFLLYAGIRNDSFDNKNGSGASFVKQDNIWQPRFGFTWDLTGNGNSKLYGSLGRYSLPIAANVALRAASASYYTVAYYTYSGYDATTGVPNVTGPFNGGAYDYVVNGEDGSTPDPKAVAAKGLKPYTQDEAILGYQYDLSSNTDWLNGWTLSAKATYRRINNVIDDTCDVRSLYDAATAAGYTLSNWEDEWTIPDGLPGCYLFNPGKDMTLTLDVDGDGQGDTITVPGSTLGPKAKRTYKALTLGAEKHVDRWYASLTYTWSKLQGNYEGLVKSTNGQDDTGTTSDFDFAEIMYGADGYLFNDHRHSFKLYGGFKFNDEWQVGANILVQSGAPISCLGGGYGTFGTEYGYSGVFHTCNSDNIGNEEISKLGTAGRTPWTATFSPNVVYTPKWLEGLSVQLSVLNAFNSIKPLQVFETKYGLSSSGTITDYYNYKVGKYYTTPRYVRFQVQYDW